MRFRFIWFSVAQVSTWKVSSAVVKFVLRRTSVVQRFSHSFFRSLFMRSKSVLRMKSAEIWNYLVLCTHVYTSRVLEGPGLRESIEFSNKSVALPRVSFCIIFAWYHCLRPRHALPVRNSHAISRATYAKHHALLFVLARIAARWKKKKGKISLKIYPDFQQLFCRWWQISRFAIIKARIWKGYMLKLKNSCWNGYNTCAETHLSDYMRWLHQREMSRLKNLFPHCLVPSIHSR